MKTVRMSILVVCFLILSFSGIAHSWQGRMGGMGDPYGLVEDESCFLIHPSKITTEGGVEFYGHYRFNYRDVKDWDYTLDRIDPPGVVTRRWPHKSFGDEREHEGLLGATLPVGSGRAGLFVRYASKKGDYSGREDEWRSGTDFSHRFSLENDLEEFELMLLYGFPMSGFKFGGEIKLASHQEENGTFFDEDRGGGTRRLWFNNPFGEEDPLRNLFPFLFPFESNNSELLLKGSGEGTIGPVKVSLTIRGGFTLAGDNDLEFTRIQPGTSSGGIYGDVKGWNIGGDLWLRYPLTENLSLPLLLKIGYAEKTRDGEGEGLGSFFGGSVFDYKNREKSFQIEAGGGADEELVKGTRIAAGIYYRYIWDRYDFSITEVQGGSVFFWHHTNYPDRKEHQGILKLSGEREFTPVVTMRMGLNFFCGWIDEDYKLNTFPRAGGNPHVNQNSVDGYRWGLGASMGGTVKFQEFSLEPFLGASYQKRHVDGDGSQTLTVSPFTIRQYEMDLLTKEWSIGGGVSIKF